MIYEVSLSRLETRCITVEAETPEDAIADAKVIAGIDYGSEPYWRVGLVAVIEEPVR